VWWYCAWCTVLPSICLASCWWRRGLYRFKPFFDPNRRTVHYTHVQECRDYAIKRSKNRFPYGSYHELSCVNSVLSLHKNKGVLKRNDWINWQWQVALQGIVNAILSTNSRNTGLSTSSTRTPQRYGLKTVRHHTVDTEYRVTDSKLRILRHTPCGLGTGGGWTDGPVKKCNAGKR
jgi:hypothetical protein